MKMPDFFQRESRHNIPAFTPPEKERAIARYIRDLYAKESRDIHKYPFEWVWFQCAAFYEGHQHYVWNFVNKRVHPPDGRKRTFTGNIILPIIRRAISMLVGNEPRPTIAPASQKREDRFRSRVAERFWKARQQMTGWDADVKRAALYAATTGNVFIKTYWDPTKGRWRSTPSGIEHEGEVCRSVVNPWQVFLSPHATSVEEATWLIQSHYKPLSYIREHWDRGKYVAPAGQEEMKSWYENRLLSLTGLGGYTVTPDQTKREPMAHVIELWHRPTIDFPKGLHVVMAGDVILNPESTDNPYVGLDDRGQLEIPFIHLRWFDAIHRLWGMGLVEPLIPVQQVLNELDSDTLEATSLMAKLKYLAPVGSMSEEPDDLHGEVVEWDPKESQGIPPQLLQPSELPSYMERFRMNMSELAKMIAAQSDVTQARADGSLATGVAVGLLQQMDAAVITPIRTEFWNGLAKVAQNELTLAQKKYTTARTMKMLDSRNQWEVFSIEASDIAGATDFHYLMAEGLGDTREARIQHAHDFMNSGLFNGEDPLDKQRVAKLTGSNEMLEMFRDISAPQDEAEDENAQMVMAADMQMPVTLPAYPWQDHETHIRVHNLLRMTNEYKDLDEVARTLIDRHIEIHELEQQKQLQEELMMLQASKGTPGEKGDPSQPKTPQSGGDRTASKQSGGQAGGMG